MEPFTLFHSARVFAPLLPDISESCYVSVTLKYYKNYLTYESLLSKELSSLSSDSKVKASVKWVSLFV